MHPESRAHQRASTSRPYETEQDLRQMRGLLMEGRSRPDDWRYSARRRPDVVVFFMVTCHLNPQEYMRLWHNDEGKLVGLCDVG